METHPRAFDPADWRVLLGEYELLTEQAEGCRGPPFRSSLRLEATGDPPRLTGVEESPSGRPGGPWRQPVGLDGDELLIGPPSAEGGPSRYRVLAVSAEGFAGLWRTPQPAWLRARRPHTAEWAAGAFTARRR